MPFLPDEAAWIEAVRRPVLMDTSSARRELRWMPHHDARETLRQTIDAVRSRSAPRSRLAPPGRGGYPMRSLASPPSWSRRGRCRPGSGRGRRGRARPPPRRRRPRASLFLRPADDGRAGCRAPPSRASRAWRGAGRPRGSRPPSASAAISASRWARNARRLDRLGRARISARAPRPAAAARSSRRRGATGTGAARGRRARRPPPRRASSSAGRASRRTSRPARAEQPPGGRSPAGSMPSSAKAASPRSRFRPARRRSARPTARGARRGRRPRGRRRRSPQRLRIELGVQPLDEEGRGQLALAERSSSRGSTRSR